MVDFFRYVWQYGGVMQKIERWRVQELLLVLEQLSQTLREGKQRDWEKVFSHYHSETLSILSRDEINTEELRRLVRNIQNCFTGVESFRNLNFIEDDNHGLSDLNREFSHRKSRLIQLLNELRARLMEYVH